MPLEFFSMYQSAYFPTSYGAYGADLAPGYYVGPGGWVYHVQSPTSVTVVWSPQTKKDISQQLSGDTATKAYAELQDRKMFASAEEAKAAAITFLSHVTDPNAPLRAPEPSQGTALTAQQPQGKSMGRKRGGRGRGGAAVPAAPAAVPTWVYVSIGAVALLSVVGIAVVASRK